MSAPSSPLAAFPLVGDAAGLGSSAADAVLAAVTGIGVYLTDALPSDGARLCGQAVWLVIVLLIGYLIVASLFRRPVPDFIRWTIKPAKAVISAIGYVLLLFDLAQASVMIKLKRVPLAWYGQVVHDVTESGHRFISWLLPSIAGFSTRFPRVLAVLVIGAALLHWNNTHCPSGQASCDHPVERWADQVLDKPPAPSS